MNALDSINAAVEKANAAVMGVADEAAVLHAKCKELQRQIDYEQAKVRGLRSANDALHEEIKGLKAQLASAQAKAPPLRLTMGGTA